jgi:signal peptidase I
MEGSMNGMAGDFGPFAVPDQTLFVLGDNLPNSSDSRIWGPLPRENIVGVAEFVYFSWDSRRHSVRFDRIGLNVEAAQ